MARHQLVDAWIRFIRSFLQALVRIVFGKMAWAVYSWNQRLKKREPAEDCLASQLVPSTLPEEHA